MSFLLLFPNSLKPKKVFCALVVPTIVFNVCLAILEVLHDGFGNPKYAPCPLLVNMVTAGKKGVKTGEGFYSWTHGTKELHVSDNFKK